MAGRRAQSDGAADFASVVSEHWTAVYRLMYQMSGHRHDADELTQEAFTKALENWQVFKPGTNARAWIMRIATNLYLDERRKKSRRDTGPMIEEPASRAASHEAGLEQRELAELLRTAIEELPETARLVFHLRTTDEMSFREIGELAGISEEAARWHMHQARLKLQQRLREDESLP